MDSPMPHIIARFTSTAPIPEKLQKHVQKVKDARAQFLENIDKLAEEVAHDVVAPVCKKHGLRFRSGMGTYSFHKKDRLFFDDLSLREAPKRLRNDLLPVIALLDTPVDSTGTLGAHLRRDIEPTGEVK